MMGISNTQGLKEYAMNQLGIDSAHFADFVKGIEQGTKSTDPKNELTLPVCRSDSALEAT